MMTHRQWWMVSTVISVLLAAYLIHLWVQMNDYDVQHSQIVNESDAQAFIKENWIDKQSANNKIAAPVSYIKTGVFIQSLKFDTSSDVNLTGYIWQHYQKGIHDHIIPKEGEVGFVLPEAVNSSVTTTQAYRIVSEEQISIGWYFEARVRQFFEYNKYPFDHKTVWLRLWAEHFSDNIVLVPDFGGYDATGINDVFGIAEDIVLGTWQREDTYFDYQLSSYDTNFGLVGNAKQQRIPELRYNIVMKRKFGNAFIIYLLPLFLVARDCN